MVVHDKVYDCTSFVDEHPYVFSLLYLLRLLPLLKEALELHPTCSTHSNIPPSNPTPALLWYHKKEESLLPSPHHHQHKANPSKSPPLTYSPNSGGEEVMLDVGGQDATEAFEDVGHSDEAREILEGLLVGTVKRQPGDPTPKSSAQPTSSKTSGPDAAGLGAGLYAILLVGGALAYFAYSYLQANGEVKN
jgi:hypothetical protein